MGEPAEKRNTTAEPGIKKAHAKRLNAEPGFKRAHDGFLSDPDRCGKSSLRLFDKRSVHTSTTSAQCVAVTGAASAETPAHSSTTSSAQCVAVTSAGNWEPIDVYDGVEDTSMQKLRGRDGGVETPASSGYGGVEDPADNGSEPDWDLVDSDDEECVPDCPNQLLSKRQLARREIRLEREREIAVVEERARIANAAMDSNISPGCLSIGNKNEPNKNSVRDKYIRMLHQAIGEEQVASLRDLGMLEEVESHLMPVTLDETSLLPAASEWQDREIELTLDSGCCEHVLDVVDIPGYANFIVESAGSRRGQHFVVGNGERVPNEG